jgi:glutaredoxin
MESIKLYTVSWSLHCNEAEKLLREAKITFEKVDLDRWDLLSASSRDIGIQKLPALRINGKSYEGLKEVSIFIKERR